MLIFMSSACISLNRRDINVIFFLSYWGYSSKCANFSKCSIFKISAQKKIPKCQIVLRLACHLLCFSSSIIFFKFLCCTFGQTVNVVLLRNDAWTRWKKELRSGHTTVSAANFWKLSLNLCVLRLVNFPSFSTNHKTEFLTSFFSG